MKPNEFLSLLPALIFFCCNSPNQEQRAADNWPVYRGSASAIQYSDLDQIHTGNVDRLEKVWEYHTGDAGENTTIQCNPLIIDGVLYLSSPNLKIVALNAANGKEMWSFNPSEKNTMHGVNRGVAFWKEGEDERVFFTAGYQLFALSANNGKLIESFGNRGKVDLRENLGHPAEDLSLVVTAPGIVYGNLIIMGSSTGEGYDASPGHVRAYHVKTGELVWTFHTIPQPGEIGYDTWQWQEGVRYGAANVWNSFSLDQQRGWVFLATGSPSYDFYGASRPGDNLFGNSVVAVEAATGKYIWHYQVVHHDLWDYDLPCAPSLTRIDYRGESREVVIQPTKMGYLIVLDRETGQPVYPVREIEVSQQTELPGEVLSATQPYPETGFFTRQSLYEDDLRDFETGAGVSAREAYAAYRYEGPFTPPGFQGTLAMPGTWGGALWGGVSIDPRKQMLFVNANEIPSMIKMRPVPVEAASGDRDDRGEEHYEAAHLLFASNCASCHGLDRKGIPPAFPSLSGLSEKYSIKELTSIISAGKGAMPAYSHFDSLELKALADYLMADPDMSQIETKNEQPVRFVMAGYRKFSDASGYPYSAPPWGSLNAIDLTTGQLKWKIPLGTIPELEARDINGTGDRNFGGCISTAGNLLFIGATTDEYFRAYHSDDGALLWKDKLPAGGYAIPATYRVDGRQYVVIAAGGGGRGSTASGDSFVAYALPLK